MEFLFFGITAGVTLFALVFIYNKVVGQRIRYETYEKEKEEIRKQAEADLKELREEREQITRELEEKKSFNDSLRKIREEELERLISAQEEERKKTLEEKIQNWERVQVEIMNQNLSWIEEDQKMRELDLEDQIFKIRAELKEFQCQREAVNEAILREREMREKEHFFRIVIPQNDIDDIEVLRTIESRLKNRSVLSKLVYDVFVKRPLNEMIKRLTAGRSISGIYKITCLKTGESYIGKSTNISSRWQNHIKTACGLDGAASTTLHTRLEEEGIWNFTFEILEEADKDKLTEKEKFYIDLYQTDKQLNMRRG